MTLRSFLRTFRSAPAASQEDPWNLNVDPGKLKTPSRSAPSRANSPSNGLPSIRKGAPVTPRASNNPPVPHSVFMDAIDFRFDKLTPQDTARVREVNTLTEVLASRVASMEKLPVASGDAKFSLKALTGIEGHAKEERTQEQIELHILLESQWRFAAGKLGTLPEGFTGLSEGFAIGPGDLKNSQKARKAKAKVKSTPPDLLTPGPVQENRFDHKATRDAFDTITKHNYYKPPVDQGFAEGLGTNSSSVKKRKAGPVSPLLPKPVVKNEFAGGASPTGKAKVDADVAEMARLATSIEWKNWMKNNNIEAIPNPGTNNNCLLLSLLQHATGKYGPEAMAEHEAAATQLRAAMVKEFKDLKVDAELAPDCDAVKWAIDTINEGKEHKLRLITMRVKDLSKEGGVGLAPAINYSAESFEREAPVVVLAYGHHYQAVKGAPVSMRSPESTT